MTVPRYCGSIGVAMALASSALAAQHVAPSPAGSVVLDWGEVRVFVGPDTSRGMFVWVNAGCVSGGPGHNGMRMNRFTRVAADEWVDYATIALDARAPAAGDTVSTIFAHLPGPQPMTGIVIARTRDDVKWDREPLFVVLSGDSTPPLRLRLNAEQARALVGAVAAVASSAELDKDSATVADPPPLTAEEKAHASEPTPVRTSASPRYPDGLRMLGMDGDVVISFLVDTAGRAVVASRRIVLSTHPGFTTAVLAALPQMRFAPLVVNGRPRVTRVEQPFSFRIARGPREDGPCANAPR